MPHRTELPGAREGDKWMPQPIVILDETSPFKGLLRASGILKEYNVLITACPPPPSSELPLLTESAMTATH